MIKTDLKNFNGTQYVCDGGDTNEDMLNLVKYPNRIRLIPANIRIREWTELMKSPKHIRLEELKGMDARILEIVNFDDLRQTSVIYEKEETK